METGVLGQWINVTGDSLGALWSQVLGFLPALIGAIIIFIIGLIIGVIIGIVLIYLSLKGIIPVSLKSSFCGIVGK